MSAFTLAFQFGKRVCFWNKAPDHACWALFHSVIFFQYRNRLLSVEENWHLIDMHLLGCDQNCVHCRGPGQRYPEMLTAWHEPLGIMCFAPLADGDPAP